MKFAIAVGRFYAELAERLVAGAQRAFTAAGHDPADVYDVPGAFELPLAARYLADSGRYAGVACLGAVIRGETDHYEYVCNETARGIARVALDTGVPVTFGVLTTDNFEQALDRAGGKHGNKGWDSAMAAMEMAGLMDSLPKREG